MILILVFRTQNSEVQILQFYKKLCKLLMFQFILFNHGVQVL